MTHPGQTHILSYRPPRHRNRARNRWLKWDEPRRKPKFLAGLTLVEVLAEYSKQAHRKIDRLSTAARALQQLKSGETRPRASTGERHSQRYRIADRFSPDDLTAIAQRYVAGEQSTDLAKEHNIAKSTLLRLLAEQGIQTRQRGLTPEKER
ncbi:hypothetical protein GCM10017711_33680 [Paeniglutamicibacter sulfureus]